MTTLCSIAITTPGEPEFDECTGVNRVIRNPKHNLYVKRFIELLNGASIEGHWCDTMPGYWNLNQDWYEFEVSIDPGWGYSAFTETLGFDANREINNMLTEGHIIMMIHYVEVDDDGKKRHIPHH